MDLFEKLFIVSMLTPNGDPSNPETIWGININVIGPPGTAKSSRIRSIGKSLGVNVYTIFTPTKIPEHAGGYPAPSPYGGLSLQCAMPQVHAAGRDGRAIILLDEISSAPEAVQAAFLSFVNERSVGEYSLPPGVRIALAMNPPDVAANGRDLVIPMANRVMHCQYQPPTLSQWHEHMMGIYNPGVPYIANGEEQVREHWNTHFPTVVSQVEAFLEANGGMIEEKDEEGEVYKHSKFLAQPPADSPLASGPWPSHRTWSMAVCGVSAARCLGFEMDVQVATIANLVGKGIASEWMHYVRKQNLPQPLDVLNNPAWQAPQLDIARVVAISCAAYVAAIQDPAQQKILASKCWGVLGKVAERYKDIVIKPAKILISKGLNIFDDDPTVINSCEALMNELTSSGLLKYIK